MSNNIDLHEWYDSSISTVNTILKTEKEFGYDIENPIVVDLKTKCMQNVVILSLLGKLARKYPAISFDIELYLEGVSIE